MKKLASQPVETMSPKPLQLTIVTAGYRPGAVDAFFQYANLLVYLAEEFAANGLNVTVVSRFCENAEKSCRDVRYIFVRDALPASLPCWTFSSRLTETVRSCSPDLVHFHGLNFPLQALHLRRTLPKETGIVGEYHADSLKHGLKRWLVRQGLNAFDTILFANTDHALRWQTAMSPWNTRIRFSPEGSSPFQYRSRIASRAKTGMSGTPVLLWNSRLIHRRDPITVLTGFELFARHSPLARFYLMPPEADPRLLGRVRQMIAGSEVLSRSVTLTICRRPYPEMEAIYNSSDYLISGSFDDAYGFGAADAMSCGVIPVVTNIATFREITCMGEYGRLWEPGNPEDLHCKLKEIVEESYHDIDRHALRVARYFQEHLSYPVIAAGLNTFYQEVAENRKDSRNRNCNPG